MNILSSIDALIGRTPLLRLERTERALGLSVELLAKAEFLEPSGSAKDRAVLYMLDKAEEKGLLHPGSVIIEPTSGNTGIGLAAVGVPRGYRVIIVMPDTMSRERQQLMRAYGAEVILTPGALGMAGSIAEAERLAAELDGAFIPDQFSNTDNALAHFETTGPEIFSDCDGRVDIFVAGIGTGGTLTGAGEYLKSRNPEIKIVGVEPKGSPLLSQGFSGPHDLQGIGANFIPKVLNKAVYDEIFPVADEDAYAAARDLARREGYLTGITSGAALHAAIELAKQPENTGKTIVALLPDTGGRYLSTKLYSEV